MEEYFVFSTIHGFMLCSSAEEARAYANDELQAYITRGGWADDGFESICWGVVKGRVNTSFDGRNRKFNYQVCGVEEPDKYSIGELQRKIYQQNKEAGWWDEPREKGTLLCLIHSEISEAMEGERRDLMDDHLPHRKMAEVELADAVIRILDYAEAFGYDVEGAIKEKLEYNKHREDHKKVNRRKTNGKKF